MKLKFWKKQANTSSPAPQRTRHIWETPGQLGTLSSIAQAPRVDFVLYDALREGIPLIDAAISHLVRLVGTPKVVGDKRVVDHLNQFFSGLRVLGYNQVGLNNFMRLHLDTLLMYGKSAAEIVLTNARTAIYGLKPIPVETLLLRPAADGKVEIRQRQADNMEGVLVPSELLFYSVNRPRVKRPHGTSLLASLPFVADIWLNMAWSLGQTWQRFGIPRYNVNIEEPEDFSLGEAERLARLEETATQFTATAEARRDMESIKDFFSMGKTTVSIIGAEGQNLQFQVPHRALMEQMIMVTGLPPAWLGISWSASERLGSEQAIHATDLIAGWRNELQPDIENVAQMELALAAISGAWRLEWDKVNLTDRTVSAQADMMEAQAQAISQKTEIEAWRQGWKTQTEAAQAVYPDLQAVAVSKDMPEAPAVGGGFGAADALVPYEKISAFDNWRPLRDVKLRRLAAQLHSGMVESFQPVEDTFWAASGLPRGGGNGSRRVAAGGD